MKKEILEREGWERRILRRRRKDGLMMRWSGWCRGR
jgi:hypothetical protein